MMPRQNAEIIAACVCFPARAPASTSSSVAAPTSTRSSRRSRSPTQGSARSRGGRARCSRARCPPRPCCARTRSRARGPRPPVGIAPGASRRRRAPGRAPRPRPAAPRPANARPGRAPGRSARSPPQWRPDGGRCRRRAHRSESRAKRRGRVRNAVRAVLRSGHRGHDGGRARLRRRCRFPGGHRPVPEQAGRTAPPPALERQGDEASVRRRRALGWRDPERVAELVPVVEACRRDDHRATGKDHRHPLVPGLRCDRQETQAHRRRAGAMEHAAVRAPAGQRGVEGSQCVGRNWPTVERDQAEDRAHDRFFRA